MESHTRKSLPHVAKMILAASHARYSSGQGHSWNIARSHLRLYFHILHPLIWIFTPHKKEMTQHSIQKPTATHDKSQETPTQKQQQKSHKYSQFKGVYHIFNSTFLFSSDVFGFHMSLDMGEAPKPGPQAMGCFSLFLPSSSPRWRRSSSWTWPSPWSPRWCCHGCARSWRSGIRDSRRSRCICGSIHGCPCWAGKWKCFGHPSGGRLLVCWFGLGGDLLEFVGLVLIWVGVGLVGFI